MAITTSETFKKGSRGEYCSVCKERKLLLRMADAGLICSDCDPRADESPIKIASPEAPAETAPES